MTGRIVILTGTSGSGKTTIAVRLGASPPAMRVLHFDSIGAPSVADMIAGHGSPEGWQYDAAASPMRSCG